MARTETFYTRVDPKLKAEVESIFEKLGMTPSEAITIFLKQVVLRHGLPFEVKVPQLTKKQAMEILMEQIEESEKQIEEGKYLTLEQLSERLGI